MSPHGPRSLDDKCGYYPEGHESLKGFKQDRDSISYENEGHSYHYVLGRRESQGHISGVWHVIQVRKKGVLKWGGAQDNGGQKDKAWGRSLLHCLRALMASGRHPKAGLEPGKVRGALWLQREEMRAGLERVVIKST